MTRRCAYVHPWSPHTQCWRPVLIGRVCLEHKLERLRFEWRTGADPDPALVVTLDLSNLNRPRVQVDDGRPRRWAAVSWGNGNSDPVWMIRVKWRQ